MYLGWVFLTRCTTMPLAGAYMATYVLMKIITLFMFVYMYH